MQSLIHQKFQRYQLVAYPLGHCKASCDYVMTQPSLKAAWDNCPTSSWLWWIVDDLITAKVLDKDVMETLEGARCDGHTQQQECESIRKVVPYKTILNAFKQLLRNKDV